MSSRVAVPQRSMAATPGREGAPSQREGSLNKSKLTNLTFPSTVFLRFIYYVLNVCRCTDVLTNQVVKIIA